MASNITENNFDTWNNFVDSLNINKTCLLSLHVNIRSMIKNFNQIELTIANCRKTIHLIILTEANINDSCKQLFQLDGYTMHTELRNYRKGGGIVLYTHNSINFSRTELCTYNFECIMGEISTNQNNYKTGVCAIYRPPDKNKHLFIEELTRLNKKHSINSDYLILGDMNINLKNHDNIRYNYLSKLSEYGLECGINQYTRIEKKENKITRSCIDHIFYRGVGDRELFTAVINIAPADHCITGCLIKYKTVDSTSHLQNKTVAKLDFKKIKSEIKRIDWSDALLLKDPNKIMTLIIEKFTHLYDSCKYYSKKHTGRRKTCEWANKKLSNMCKQRDKLYKIWKYDESNAENRLKYNNFRNKTIKYTNYIKNNHTKSEISNNFKNTKKLWQIINKLCGKMTKSIDNIICHAFKSNMKQITNEFAEGFSKNVKNICIDCQIPLLIMTHEHKKKSGLRRNTS